MKHDYLIQKVNNVLYLSYEDTCICDWDEINPILKLQVLEKAFRTTK